MNYSNDPARVRVDIFKPSGKWYSTIELHWDRYTTVINGQVENINDTFKRCMNKQYSKKYENMIAICLEPYHQNSFPLMITL